MSLNEYDKVQLQGVVIDDIIEKMWAERTEVMKIIKKSNYVSRKKSGSKNSSKRK